MKRYEIREAFMLGSAKSGFYGHKGRPGKRGGSAAKSSNLAVRKVSKDIHAPPNPYYEVKRGQVLPDEVTSMQSGVVLYRSGELHVMPDIPDTMRITHIHIMDAENVKAAEFDSYARPWVSGGTVNFDYRQMGVKSYQTESGQERAETNAIRTARSMLNAGFLSDTPIAWIIRPDVRLRMTLGTM